MCQDKSQLSEFLDSFFKKMNEWGLRVINLYTKEPNGPQKYQEAMRSELQVIFDEYLTKRDRKTGRLQVLAVSIGQPDYDPKFEKLIKIEKSREGFLAYTKKNYSTDDYFEEYRYKIKKTTNGMKIDTKERFSSEKNGWVKETI